MNEAYCWYRPIQKLGKFYPGRVLNLVTAPNIYSDYLSDYSLMALTSKYFSNGLTPHGFFQLIPHEKGDSNFAEPIAELVFELVRQLHFPDAPSRLTSLYASATLEQAEQWKLLWVENFIATQDEQIPRYLWKIEFETSASLYDAKLLEVSQNDEFSYLKYLDNAYRYWRGEKSSDPLYELLIPFPVTVVERII